MKIKICGMKHRDNIIDVAALSPDYMGFIIWDKSPRNFDKIMPEIPKSIKKIGVFVNASFEEILASVKTFDFDMVQLHGDESAHFCNQIRHENIATIKAFAVDDNFDFESLTPYEPVCDFFLFDTKGKMPGGNGISFNWDILQKYTGNKPIFLSGGIGPDDIEKIAALNFKVHAIDVNSGFESEPGLKNTALLEAFVKQIKTL